MQSTRRSFGDTPFGFLPSMPPDYAAHGRRQIAKDLIALLLCERVARQRCLRPQTRALHELQYALNVPARQHDAGGRQSLKILPVAHQWGKNDGRLERSDSREEQPPSRPAHLRFRFKGDGLRDIGRSKLVAGYG